MFSASASKVRDVRSSVKKDYSSLKNRRSVSVDSRSRGSYVPERIRVSSDERKSGSRPLDGFNRWSGTRKSSINLVDAKRKDCRPLSDKQYQKRKIADLVLFLEEAGFGYPIKESKLAALSKKDFENIFKFLYNTLDPSYEVKKIEEDAPKILKNLGYPFTVSKQAFMYCARTHFQSLLGVMIWLMDISKFAMRLDLRSILESGGDEKSQMHTILLRFICQSYHSGQDNEEDENNLFKSMIKTLMPENLDELVKENEEIKEKINYILNELNEMKELAEKKAMHDLSIEKYEDYIVNMRSHFQKKNEMCEELITHLNKKEAELKELQDNVSQKQDAYDAQGFDGKKQLSFFQMQKQELTEKLEKKRAMLAELQDKIWDAEIQYNKNLDKVNAASESFNELYNKVTEKVKTILQPLQTLKNPMIQKLCNSFDLGFPSWEISPRTKSPELKIQQENTLQSMSDRVKGIGEIFKRIMSSQSEKLSEAQMKISDASIQLKLLDVQKTQLEHDCTLKEKQAVDELASLEAQCDKIMNAVIALQAERTKLEKHFHEMSHEITVLVKFREQKEKELNDYLAEQSQIFSYYSETEQEVSEKSLLYGSEIYQNLEELILSGK